MATIYQIDLACGDTIASAVAPRLGAYRKCIHCDGSRKVTGVREPNTLARGEDFPHRASYATDTLDQLVQDPLF